MSEKRSRGFMALAGIGVGILLATVTIQLVGAVRGENYEISHSIFYVAMVLGFVGFYGLDPKRAKDGGQFIADNALRFVSILRTGRRSTDAVAVVTEPKPPPREGDPG